ncbi:uncharacterized protein B0I36DRAFT_368933 [Microdochium trichocladiopsis]|uniref:Uncharacterized protein n=1 Tax=Microdochium trichocladiopsis TaxID=1682393 RepID=A0A9P8XTC5_9PEZI|nr:uncharacterized protein B0I36DRAFT_368933 [Microdochium trichocladiopsis]KAH7016397.1 hypothetical protein B0I36DRAFT_368933 [Microdochium trichocladiopsis]
MATPFANPHDSPSPLQRSMASAMGSVRRFASKTSASSSTRARVGFFLAAAAMFLIAVAFNLQSVYSYRWQYPYHSTAFVISLVFELIISRGMLGMLATVVRDFSTSLIVGLVGMGIYIAIQFLANECITPQHGRVIACWSVLTFWIVFAVDAVLKIGFSVTSWLASRLEDGSTGRIRLGPGVDAVGAAYADYPEVRADRNGVAVDLERGEAPSPKAGAGEHN